MQERVQECRLVRRGRGWSRDLKKTLEGSALVSALSEQLLGLTLRDPARDKGEARLPFPPTPTPPLWKCFPSLCGPTAPTSWGHREGGVS